MLPGLGNFFVAIIGACLLVGLVTILSERRARKKGKPLKPVIILIVIIAIIIFFAGYLVS